MGAGASKFAEADKIPIELRLHILRNIAGTNKDIELAPVRKASFDELVETLGLEIAAAIKFPLGLRTTRISGYRASKDLQVMQTCKLICNDVERLIYRENHIELFIRRRLYPVCYYDPDGSLRTWQLCAEELNTLNLLPDAALRKLSRLSIVLQDDATKAAGYRSLWIALDRFASAVSSTRNLNELRIEVNHVGSRSEIEELNFYLMLHLGKWVPVRSSRPIDKFDHVLEPLAKLSGISTVTIEGLDTPFVARLKAAMISKDGVQLRKVEYGTTSILTTRGDRDSTVKRTRTAKKFWEPVYIWEEERDGSHD